MHILQKMPLRYKILLLCLSILLFSLLTFFFISNSIFAGAFLKSSRQSSANELTLINQNIGSLTERTATYLRLLSINPALQQELRNYKNSHSSHEKSLITFSFPKTISNIASGLFSPSSYLCGCVVSIGDDIVYPPSAAVQQEIHIGLPAEFIARTDKIPTPVWQTQPFRFSYASGEGSPALDALTISTANVVAVSKRIIDRDNGKTLGVLTLLLRSDAFSSIFDESDANSYYLVDADNKIVSCANRESLHRQASDVFQCSDNDLRALRENSTLELRNHRHAFLLTLVHNQVLNWDLIRYRDLSLLMQEERSVRLSLILVFLLTSALAIPAVWISATSISHPISVLMSIIKKYDGRNMSVRVPDHFSGEMGVLAAGFNHLLDKVDQNVKDIQLAQEQHHRYELSLLQSQIQPHFLYNTLQTTASLIIMERFEEGLESIYSLSDFYKYCLSSGKNVITVGEEVEILKKYLKIQHLRYSDYFDYSIDAEDDVKLLPIPKLTLQPLVENAIYHGLKPKGSGGHLVVSARETAEGACLEVLDSGVGMDEATIRRLLSDKSCELPQRSFGIHNVIERLRLLYGDRFQIGITSSIGEYTSVSIQLHREVMPHV